MEIDPSKQRNLCRDVFNNDKSLLNIFSIEQEVLLVHQTKHKPIFTIVCLAPNCFRMFEKQEEYLEHKFDCFLKQSGERYEDILSKSRKIKQKSELDKQLKLRYSQHSWRSWDLFYKSTHLETNEGIIERSIPEDVKDKWGFDVDDVHKYCIRVRNKTYWEKGFNNMAAKLHIKEDFHFYLKKNNCSVSNALIDLLKKKEPSSHLLPPYHSCSYSNIDKQLTKLNLSFEDIDKIFKSANEYNSMCHLASTIPSIASSLKRGDILKRIFVNLKYNLNELSWYKPKDKNKRRKKNIIIDRNGTLSKSESEY